MTNLCTEQCCNHTEGNYQPMGDMKYEYYWYEWYFLFVNTRGERYIYSHSFTNQVGAHLAHPYVATEWACVCAPTQPVRAGARHGERLVGGGRLQRERRAHRPARRGGCAGPLARRGCQLQEDKAALLHRFGLVRCVAFRRLSDLLAAPMMCRTLLFASRSFCS